MIDFSQVIQDLNGDPLLDNSQGIVELIQGALKALDGGDTAKATSILRDGLQDDERVLTLRKVTSRALLNVEGAKSLNGEAKMKRGQLALRIFDSEEPMALGVDDLKTIKDAVGKTYGPLIVARVWALVDPAGSGDG